MCNGVVISLISFKNKKKNVRVVLSGIGSHSSLVSDNLKKLKRAGWKENAIGERIISIESDFSAWNKFTVECGEPNRNELKILRSAYKKCAGDATHLIAHVKRCNKLDDSLVNLLTEDARTEYEKVKAPAWTEYEKVTAQARTEYEKVTAPARTEYEKVKAQAWIKYFSIKANRVPHLQ